MFSRKAYEFKKKYCLEQSQLKKLICIRITSVSAYVNVSYFFTFLAFPNVSINSSLGLSEPEKC